MQNNFNKVIAILIIGYFLVGCVSYNQLLKGPGNLEQARKNVITDIANTYTTKLSRLIKRKGRPFDVFLVTENSEESKDNLWTFVVLPEIEGYISLRIYDRLGEVPSSLFPNNFEIKKGKLFLWQDSVTPLRKNILNAIEDYGLLDSTSIKRELGLLPEGFVDTRVITFDDGLKVVRYYVCKNRTEKYKKVVIRKAFKEYKKPKLNCNTP